MKVKISIYKPKAEFMKKQIIFLALSMMFLIACNSAKQENPDLKTFDLEAVKMVIDEANKGYNDRFTQDSAVFYREKYTKDACLMPIAAPEVCGRENIKSYYYGDGENTKFKITVTAKEVIGGEDLVAETGSYEVFYVSGKKHDNGKFIAIWHQEDGNWKLHREIWSSDLPKPIEE